MAIGGIISKVDRVSGYTQETKVSIDKIADRENLYRLFTDSPLPIDQLLINLGLYMRSGSLAKVLFINELYELIKAIPGVILEFGCWWGQNIALFENLRAIYEPFNQNRRIIGFDTFKGYASLSNKDKASDTIKVGGYSTSEGYKEYLEALVSYHEGNNVLSHIKKHTIIDGNVAETVPAFFCENPETIIALAYFDLALYEPTKACLEAIKPHLIKGSVVMLDELNWKEYPGETVAFKEAFRSMTFTIRQSKYMSDRTIIILE